MTKKTTYSSSAKTFSFEELEQTLIYFSSSIHGKNTEEEILWDLAQNCIAKLDFLDCVIYMIDPTRKKLIQKAAFGPKNPRKQEILDPITIPLGKGITGSVALTGKAELIQDTSKDPRYIIDDEVRLSEITVPIKLQDEVLGIIDCEHPEKGFFTQQHLRLLSAIASICAIKISKVRAEETLKKEQQQRLQVQKQIAELKVKAFRTQMKPHFIFNALNAIQYYITVNDKKSALNYLSLFSKLIRHHLDHFDNDFILLEEELNVVNWHLKLQSLRYEDRFEYHISYLPKDHDLNVKIPARVLSALTEQAVETATIDHQKKIQFDLNLHIDSHTVNTKLSFNIDLTKTLPKKEQLLTPDYWLKNTTLINELYDHRIEGDVDFIETPAKDLVKINISLNIPIVN